MREYGADYWRGREGRTPRRWTEPGMGSYNRTQSLYAHSRGDMRGYGVDYRDRHAGEAPTRRPMRGGWEGPNRSAEVRRLFRGRPGGGEPRYGGDYGGARFEPRRHHTNWWG